MGLLTDRIWWGLPPVDSETVTWGARAILATGQLDILWDRQSWQGTPDECEAVRERLNAGALSKARAAWKRMYDAYEVNGYERRLVTLYDEGPGGLVIEADSRGSCGYVYLRASLRGD